MKILLAVHHFPPRYSAGAELYVYRLARWLLAHGHQAEVVCVEEVDYARPAGLTAHEERYDGIPVQRLRLGMAGAAASWGYDHPLVNAWLRGHLARSRPDLVHLHSGYLLGAGVIAEAHRAGVATAVTLHDFWFLCPRYTLLRGNGQVCDRIPADPAGCAWCLRCDQRRFQLADRLAGGLAERAWIALHPDAGDGIAARRAFLRAQLARASLILAPSKFLAAQFQDEAAATQLQVLEIGIDTERLQGLAPPAVDDPLRVGYVGQITPHKGVELLVRAFTRLPRAGRPVTLQIHGDLTQHREYSARLRRIAEGDRRIQFAGRFEAAAARAVFGALDLLVVPSIWYENRPLVILEARAAGRPVVTAAMGGMAELVRDEVDGLLYSAGDVADLARQLARLRDEPGLLERLRAGVRPPKTVANELSALVALYAAVLSSAAPLEVA